MGIYDFVVGIGVGILLAFVSMIFQTSQVSAVRATYSGEIVNSTVRRNPSQQHYLTQVASQIYVIKLAGYLFFGTIVGVEEKIRALIADEAFERQPIRYLVIDLRQVTGLDYSAGEAFNTVSRLLEGRGIRLILSGVEAEGDLGRDLRTLGLGELGIMVSFLPDLNSALESCENELLKTFYARKESVRGHHRTVPASSSLEVPDRGSVGASLDWISSSPRRRLLHEAARASLADVDAPRLSKWQNFQEPLRLMLQIFQDVSDRNEDFWFPAMPYFARQELAAGTVLFRVGDPADGFYLLEKGILRAEYTLPAGHGFHESIVAGTTCGELPFFSETTRTATATAELEVIVWVLRREAWKKLQKEQPEVAHELLRVGLKLTAERMSTVPSSTMLMGE
jgi:sulfate permease, SulP family